MRAVGRGDTINPTDGFDKSPRSAGVDGDPHNVRGCHEQTAEEAHVCS